MWFQAVAAINLSLLFSMQVTFVDPANPATATITPQPPPQPPVKVVEGYSDPKDSKRQHRAGRREQSSKRPTSLGSFKPYNRLYSDSGKWRMQKLETQVSLTKG